MAVTTSPTPFGGVLTSAIIFGINVLVFYLHDRLAASHARSLEAALYAQEREYYLTQCRMMQESLEQTRSVRHDMITHFAALRGITAKNRDEEAAVYLDKLLADTDQVQAYSDTGNVVFDSIINYKLKNAEQHNIKPDIRLRIPPSLDIDPPDIAAILGNLLDNALHATARVPEKTIKLDIEYSRQALFMLVENTFDGIVNYPQGIAEKRLPVSSKPSGGHGLKNILRAVEKYNGLLDITHNESVFSVTVFLYIKDSAAFAPE